MSRGKGLASRGPETETNSETLGFNEWGRRDSLRRWIECRRISRGPRYRKRKSARATDLGLDSRG